jgi:hypothetical protein
VIWRLQVLVDDLGLHDKLTARQFVEEREQVWPHLQIPRG